MGALVYLEAGEQLVNSTSYSLRYLPPPLPLRERAAGCHPSVCMHISAQEIIVPLVVTPQCECTSRLRRSSCRWLSPLSVNAYLEAGDPRAASARHQA